MLILDTDVLSILEWAGSSSPAERLAARLEETKDEIVTTVISLEELMRGWMASLAQTTKVSEHIEIYRRLRRRFESLCKMRLLDFDETAAVRFQDLKKRKIKVGTMDLKIAAIALAYNATVLSGIVRDFERIPDLKVNDWKAL
jgi:tRNA(fMet)-specific endonuclease VapC